MEFGYFTLSDNHYENNTARRQPVRRRHHRRGALRRPARHALGLDRRASFQFARRALVARAGARLHRGAHQAHPARAGGQRDAAASSDPRRRAMGDARPALATAASISPPAAATTAANTRRSTCRSPTTRASSKRAWRSSRSCGARTASRIDHHGKHYQFEDVRITPKPMQKPLPVYIGSFSKPSIELAARLGFGLIVAPFAAAMSYGGLKQVADLYNETCVKHGNKPRPADVQLLHAISPTRRSRRRRSARARSATTRSA